MGEHGELAVEICAHAGVLTALSGEHEHCFAGALWGQQASAQQGVCAVVGQGVQCGQRIGCVVVVFAVVLNAGGDGGAVGVVAACGSQAVGYIDRIQIGVGAEMLVQTGRLCA